MPYLIAAACVFVAGIAIGIGACAYSLRNVTLTPDQPNAFK